LAGWAAVVVMRGDELGHSLGDQENVTCPPRAGMV